MKPIHKNLKALRVESGLKQEEIAVLVGITGKNWSSYERGKTEPNIETLVKLATEFKITVDTLVRGDVSPIAKTLVRKKQENASLNASPSASLNEFQRLEEPFVEYGKDDVEQLKKLVEEQGNAVRQFKAEIEQIAENRYLKARIKDLEATLTDKLHSLQRLEHELKLCQQTKANMPHK